MLTSMLLSQQVNYDGDVDEFVQQMTRHRSPVSARTPLPSPWPTLPAPLIPLGPSLRRSRDE